MSEGKSNVGLWIAIGLGGLFALVLVVAVVFGLFWARSTVVHASHSPTRPAPGTTTTAVPIAQPTRGTLTITLEAGVVIDTQFVKNGQ